MKKHRRAWQEPPTYTVIHELMADAIAPMPAARRTYQLTRMWQGLAAIERDAQPTRDDWRVCSDAVNLLETMVVDLKVLQDQHGLLRDAVAAMTEAGRRHLATGGPIRLTATGMQAVRAVLEDYAAALEALPERTIIRAHRLTERRIREIQHGKRRAGDVEVTVL